MADDAVLDAENAAMIREEGRAGGFVITRAAEAEPMRPRKPRGVADPAAMLHPATLRGLQQMREDTGPPGAAAMVLFSSETMHVSYAWFKSGYPLPLHSHDADCYYLVVGGAMKVGTEVLGKGDGVRRAFVLRKGYASGPSSYWRPITKPVTGTVLAGTGEVELRDGLDFEVNPATGVITFAVAPEDGAPVTAGFEFDVPVRFDTDRIAVSVASFQAGDLPQVPVLEVRL